MLPLLYRFFTSLRLTAWLLVASLVLIFFGTLDQVHLGVHAAQQKYFQSVIAIWEYPVQWPGGSWLRHVHLPIPGGYLIGPLMLVNLCCAHFRYFRRRWTCAGIALIHLGIAILLVGELATNLTREEHYLWFEEGQTVRHITSFHDDELVLIDHGDPDIDRVVAIPARRLKRDRDFTHLQLPFRVRVLHYYENAVIHRGAGSDGGHFAPRVTRGLAPTLGLQAQPVPRTATPGERNTTTAIVEISTPEGSLGTWLVSNVFERNLPPQYFEYDGRSYEIALRYARRDLPFSLHLVEFTHERYPGTRIPRNFASRVHLRDTAGNEDREVVVFMNNPLRTGGYTFYQSSFGADSAGREDSASQLQVVRNPSWMMPYVATLLITMGMMWQFGYRLWRHTRAPEGDAAHQSDSAGARRHPSLRAADSKGRPVS